MVPLLQRVLAQETAVRSLARALAEGRVHHAYLFDGPEGVGKELAAFGLAQALVCERRADADAACGECGACTRAVPREDRRTRHPDVVVLERGLYEPAQLGRRTPETQDLSIDQVRTLVLARTAFPPHEGRAQVFVIRRAEELSVAAANALLKTLEEPPKKTHFVLLSSQPALLLPTIRSRTQRVRFAPLPNAVIARLLTERGVTANADIPRLSGGSMAVALALADPDESARRAAFVDRALQALDAKTARAGLALAEEAKKAPKEQLAKNLEALADALALAASGATLDGPLPEGDRGAHARAADLAAGRHRLALAALRDLEANASPQLTVESMVLRMRALT